MVESSYICTCGGMKSDDVNIVETTAEEEDLKTAFEKFETDTNADIDKKNEDTVTQDGKIDTATQAKTTASLGKKTSLELLQAEKDSFALNTEHCNFYQLNYIRFPE